MGSYIWSLCAGCAAPLLISHSNQPAHALDNFLLKQQSPAEKPSLPLHSEKAACHHPRNPYFRNSVLLTVRVISRSVTQKLTSQNCTLSSSGTLHSDESHL